MVEGSELGRNFGGQWIGNLRGENGGEYVADTDSHEGEWFALVVLEDAVFTSLTQNMTNTAAVITPFVWTAGSVVYGYTTEFELASGTVQAVKF